MTSVEPVSPQLTRKLSAQRFVWNPSDVVRDADRRESPSPLFGQHAPVGRPRDVHEVREQRIRPRLTHESRREIEVVVVEEDECIGLVVQLGNNRLRERLVDRGVPVRPGGVQGTVDDGLVASPQSEWWTNQSSGLATTL